MTMFFRDDPLRVFIRVQGHANAAGEADGTCDGGDHEDDADRRQRPLGDAAAGQEEPSDRDKCPSLGCETTAAA
ncbi:MAG TPA: hypothetical protein VFN10_19555 [Thermoanaerobaculia bacterium]|nr:hypothetical protein [Thermoanaerobaculia bacterium]